MYGNVPGFLSQKDILVIQGEMGKAWEVALERKGSSGRVRIRV